ncbi:premnaspirodiene oxygenase-like [Olea europaea subsp. europaea]|uniref:Premnaspirodiene oxygenase-like n=1 Tax=Olea europaea subsp. europaea TaxID=158383 RepID=A0A8S0UY07_OLEEU|nr:premnaspirodiene oxygenase-like [Olea europaea subsp. europaea]
MHLKLGETSAIVISSPEIAKEVLGTQDPTFAERSGNMSSKIVWYNHTDIAFSPYNDYWRQMRKICMLEFLSSNRLDRLLPLEPMRAAFGKICKDKDTMVKLFQEGVILAAGFELADLFPSFKLLRLFSSNKVKLWAMRRKLDPILDEIIDEHKANLVRMKKDNEVLDQAESIRRGNGELGNEDLVDVFLRDIFSAGTNPPSSTIDWAMVELIRNPRVMAKAQAEVREIFEGLEIIDDTDLQRLKYLKMVMKENLRMHTLVPLVPRASRKDSEINGYFIPANAKVLVNAWEMCRDPKYWTNPESFKPERFENNGMDFTGNGHFEYTPFGSGSRMCPGTTFAIAGVELILAQLLYNFNWKLPEGINADNLDKTEKSGITASRKENLYVIATFYDP